MKIITVVDEHNILLIKRTKHTVHSLPLSAIFSLPVCDTSCKLRQINIVKCYNANLYYQRLYHIEVVVATIRQSKHLLEYVTTVSDSGDIT